MCVGVDVRVDVGEEELKSITQDIQQLDKYLYRKKEEEEEQQLQSQPSDSIVTSTPSLIVFRLFIYLLFRARQVKLIRKCSKASYSHTH